MTKRTDVTTSQEERLECVINVYKHQYGASHDLVIRHYKMLAQLYVKIREEKHAEAVWRELHEIIDTRFGKGSEQITIILKRTDKKTDVVEYEKGVFDTTTTLEVWDIRRIQLYLELALSYEARKEFSEAEELYITLWMRLTERCHHPDHVHGMEIHINMIDIAIEYMRLLRRCHRHQEAATILICVWTEYEDYYFESETLYLRLKIIIKKETNSRALLEAAKSLANVYVSCGFIDQGRTMIDDLRIQIVTGSSRDGSSCRLGKTVGKGTYVFLVTFEQIIRSHTVSYSELKASLLTETILYESNYRTTKTEKNVTVVLVHAARLRAFLTTHVRSHQKNRLEKDAFELFIKQWQSTIKRTDNVSFMFFLALLDELSKAGFDVQIRNAACASSTAIVKKLLHEGRVQEAYEVATCALDFITSQSGFHHLQNVGHGFKLSALMVGCGLDGPLKGEVNAKLSENMHQLSRKIIRQVLQACKDSKINFVRLKLRELNNLASLLGEQQNFADLEWLLDLLWTSREVQKSWDSELILAIGKRFVQARYLNSNRDLKARAIHLCEDISYNLSRVWGSLNPKSLEMSDLLSEIYTSIGHYREAQGVHESIIRLIVEGDDGDDRTVDVVDAVIARRHLDLLKQSFLRLKGWDKSANTYRDLVNALVKLNKGSSEFKNIPANVTDTWDFNKEQPSETVGKFIPPKQWEFATAEILLKQEDETAKAPKRPGMGNLRATSNWGNGEVLRVLCSDGTYQ